MAKANGSGASEPVARRLSGAAVERPREELPRCVPVALRSVQHVFVSAGRFEPASSRRIVLIEWVISGQAATEVAGQRLRFGPGQVAVYLPGVPMRFWAERAANEMCWFTLDGPLAEQFALELELRAGVYPYGPAPVKRIAAMMQALRDHTVQGRRAASLMAIDMLYQLANTIRAPAAEPTSAVQETKHIVEQEFADPDLSTESIAARLHYHRGSLSRSFHQHTGVTLVDFIAEVRLQEARALLQHTEEKVAAVARKCGFRDVAYFCRWIRRHTGATPGALRQTSKK